MQNGIAKTGEGGVCQSANWRKKKQEYEKQNILRRPAPMFVIDEIMIQHLEVMWEQKSGPVDLYPEYTSAR